MPYELLKSCFNFTEFFWNSWIWIKVSRKIIILQKIFILRTYTPMWEVISGSMSFLYSLASEIFFPMIYKKDLPMIAYFELKIISWKQNKKEERGKLFDSWEITILHFNLTSFLNFYHLGRSILIWFLFFIRNILWFHENFSKYIIYTRPLCDQI